jgi:uncharacterized protein (UPF0216 family)
MRVSENRVLRRIFGLKSEQVPIVLEMNAFYRTGINVEGKSKVLGHAGNRTQ